MNAELNRLTSKLVELLGQQSIIQDSARLELLSSDVYSRGHTAALAIRPVDRDRVAPAVKAITEAGFSVTARGGGMSYTGGYIPQHDRTVIIDLAGLNRIVEINADDLFITVEAGVTWRQIHEALQPLGLRLPFFGTFSGSRATVGGGMSNGALFMATARYGTAAEIALGLEVVTARGHVVRTGQGAFRNGRPFYRTYGPDMTGLFIHDAGVLGIKTLVSLKVIQTPSHLEYASFIFTETERVVSALSAIARSDAAEEAYVFDPATTRRSLDPGTLRQDLRRLANVVKGQGSLLRGLKEGAKMVGSGRRFMDGEVYSLHLVCAGRSAPAVAADLAACRKIIEESGGGEIANTIPKAARSNPFEPLNGILGSEGERWAALNAKVAHSDAMALIRRTESLLADYREKMDAAGLTTSFLFIAISNHAFSYEPVLRWFDEWLPLHRSVPEADHLARLTEPPPNPAAHELADEIRAKIVDLFADFGAASNQIGKTYPYMASLCPETAGLITAIKAELDPDGLMNPGALGMPGEAL